MPRSPCIELAPDAADHAFAQMLATLVRQNLDDTPRKAERATTLAGEVAIVVTDLDLAVTIRFDHGRIVFHGGLVGRPDVTVRAGSDWVAKLSLVERLPGPVYLPDPRGPVAREVREAERRGEVVTQAPLSATGLALGLSELLSVH